MRLFISFIVIITDNSIAKMYQSEVDSYALCSIKSLLLSDTNVSDRHPARSKNTNEVFLSYHRLYKSNKSGVKKNILRFKKKVPATRFLLSYAFAE